MQDTEIEAKGKRQKCSNGNNKRKQANTREGMKRVIAEPCSVSLRTQRKQERSRKLEEIGKTSEEPFISLLSPLILLVLQYTHTHT